MHTTDILTVLVWVLSVNQRLGVCLRCRAGMRAEKLRVVLVLFTASPRLRQLPPWVAVETRSIPEAGAIAAIKVGGVVQAAAAAGFGQGFAFAAAQQVAYA